MSQPAPDPKDELQNSAKRVLQTEAKALETLAQNIPADFNAAIEEILSSKGRVIVSGIGKSGHVARKFSATLASTGTPSHYVHPAEASHGDLGMISAQDVVILLSNSGETTELRDIITHCHRFSIPIIAISSRQESTLMHAAKWRLLMPKAAEACAIGMAPTTSTTMMMAFGDAVAVALMERRNFRTENFHELHPGGHLGSKVATVAHLMHGNGMLPLVDAQTPMSETLLTMTSKGFGIVAVTENDELKGVISDGDLRRHMDDLMTKTAGQIASPNPITITPDQFGAEALRIMQENKISALIVVNGQKEVIGILHLQDLLRAGVI